MAGHIESLLRSLQRWSSDYEPHSEPGDHLEEESGHLISSPQPPSANNNNNSVDVGFPHGWNGDLGLMEDFLPEQIPANLRSVFTVSYVVIMVLAVVGNAATILVIAANREMRTVTNIFLLSLAVSDALIAIVNMPVQLSFYLRNEWTMGEAMCKFSPYVQGVVIVASILTLTTLAIDRYYAICHPLRARHVHTITRAVVLASAIWAAAILLVLPQLFVQRLEPKLVFETDEATRLTSLRAAFVCAEYFGGSRPLAAAYTCVFYVVLYVFPVVTMFSTYGTIAAKLWRRRPIGESATSVGDPSRRERTRRLREKRRVVRMLVVVVVMFAVCWFPFFTLQVYLLTDAGQRRLSAISFRSAMAFFQLLGYSNSCANPIVYCFMNDSFQKNFLKTLRCRWASSSMGREETGPSGGGVSHQRRRSSCTDADKVNGVTTTRNTAVDHTTTTV